MNAFKLHPIILDSMLIQNSFLGIFVFIINFRPFHSVPRLGLQSLVCLPSSVTDNKTLLMSIKALCAPNDKTELHGRQIFLNGLTDKINSKA